MEGPVHSHCHPLCPHPHVCYHLYCVSLERCKHNLKGLENTSHTTLPTSLLLKEMF